MQVFGLFVSFNWLKRNEKSDLAFPTILFPLVLLKQNNLDHKM